jgi:hypothetical protein
MPEHEEHVCNCGGNCSCGESVQEVYLTREEYVVELEKYLQRLHEEIQSVEAELSSLRQTA